MAQIQMETACLGEVTWPDISHCIYNDVDEATLLVSQHYHPIDSDISRDEINNTVPVSGEYELTLGLLLLLPTPIIHDILARLPVEDLLRCRVVCKSWYRLTKDPEFITLQVSKAILPPHSSLVKQCIPGGGNKLFLLNSGNNPWTTKEIPLKRFQQDYIPCVSCDGMLCISSIEGKDPVIYNPITKDCLMLPKSDSKCYKLFPVVFGYAFGYDSINKKYKVVRVFNMYYDIVDDKFHTRGEICTLGESSWRPLNFPHKVLLSSILRPVCLNDDFQWGIHRDDECSHLDYILVLNIISEKFQTIKFPPSVKLPNGNVQLIQLGESLALVNNSSRPPQVWKVVGNRVAGGRLYHYSFDMSDIDGDGHTRRWIEFIGMLSNGDLLYNAFQKFEDQDVFHHFLCYSPRRNKSFRLQIPGISRWIDAILFTPSLALPSAFLP